MDMPSIVYPIAATGATLAAGYAVAKASRKGKNKHDMVFNGGGDVWPNTDEACAAYEYKCFYSPKSFGK